MRGTTVATRLALGCLLVATLTACTSSESSGQGDPRSETSSADTQPTTQTGKHPDDTPTPGSVVPTVNGLPTNISLTPGVTVADHLDVPWGIAFLPRGDALVTERDTARILLVTPGGVVRMVATVPGVTPTSEGGLLGVAVSPDFGEDKTVFVYATTSQDNRVLAGTVKDYRTGDLTAILTGIPRGDIHNGGRLAFGPDGMLYVTTGETGDGALAQDVNSLGGKVLRVEADGSIPEDNPFPGSPVWSYGHRNVQGLTWDDQDRLWTSEFGSELWDEINMIEPGNNYGWPAAEGTAGLPQMTDPSAVFSTDAASPSGLAYADGALWMAALQGQTTWRVPVAADGALGEPAAVKIAEARTRTVVASPDGRLWVTTSATDGRAEPEAADDSIIVIQP